MWPEAAAAESPSRSLFCPSVAWRTTEVSSSMGKTTRNVVLLGRVLVKLYQRFTQASLSKRVYLERIGPHSKSSSVLHHHLSLWEWLRLGLAGLGVGGERS